MASVQHAEHREIKLLLESKEYIRWLELANRRGTTAAGLARWLALEYMARVAQREAVAEPE